MIANAATRNLLPCVSSRGADDGARTTAVDSRHGDEETSSVPSRKMAPDTKPPDNLPNAKVKLEFQTSFLSLRTRPVWTTYTSRPMLYPRFPIMSRSGEIRRPTPTRLSSPLSGKPLMSSVVTEQDVEKYQMGNSYGLGKCRSPGRALHPGYLLTREERMHRIDEFVKPSIPALGKQRPAAISSTSSDAVRETSGSHRRRQRSNKRRRLDACALPRTTAEQPYPTLPNITASSSHMDSFRNGTVSLNDGIPPGTDQNTSIFSGRYNDSSCVIPSHLVKNPLKKAKRERLKCIKDRFDLVKSKIHGDGRYSFDDFKMEMLGFVEGDCKTTSKVSTENVDRHLDVRPQGCSAKVIGREEMINGGKIPRWQQAIMAPVVQPIP